MAEKVVKNQETLKRIQKAFSIVEANEKVADAKEGIDEYLNNTMKAQLKKQGGTINPAVKKISKIIDRK